MGLNDYNPKENGSPYTQDDSEYADGKKKFRIHIYRKRNTKLISDAKKLFKKNNGSLYCEICNFDFEKIYGEIGENFIEAHHLKRVADLDEDEKVKISDLMMLCSNCHSIVHRTKGLNTKEELKSALKYSI